MICFQIKTTIVINKLIDNNNNISRINSISHKFPKLHKLLKAVHKNKQWKLNFRKEERYLIIQFKRK